MSVNTMLAAGENRAGEDDRQIVRAAQRDPAAFQPLYRKWLKPVYRYFYFRLGDEKDAEDLTSQVFLKAIEDLPRYRERGSFSAWLFTIAHARLVDHYRRGRREAPLAEADELSVPVDLVTQTAQREEMRRMLELLGSLEEEEQELIRLRFMAELSYAEIGLIVHRKEDAVRKAIARLLNRMQAKLEGYHDEQ